MNRQVAKSAKERDKGRMAQRAGAIGAGGVGLLPNFLPHPADVASAQAEGLPDGTLNDVVDVLCILSKQFGIEFELSHDHSDGPIGYVRDGFCEDDARSQLSALAELAKDLADSGFADDGP